MIKYYIRTTGERKLDKSIDIELGGNYTLLVDTEHNARKSFVEQLECLAKMADDVVILEDDIILCRDFKNRIEEIINNNVEMIINFFYNPEYYFTTHVSDSFCWNQCVYYPNKILKILSIEMRKQYTFYPDVAHDVVENRALKMRKIPNLIYRPCLVQHIDFASLITPGCNTRRTPYFIDYLEELDISYEEAYTLENIKKLTDLMNSKFIEKLNIKKELDNF